MSIGVGCRCARRRSCWGAASSDASGAGRTLRYAGGSAPARRPTQNNVPLTPLNWRKTDICILRGHGSLPAYSGKSRLGGGGGEIRHLPRPRTLDRLGRDSRRLSIRQHSATRRLVMLVSVVGWVVLPGAQQRRRNCHSSAEACSAALPSSLPRGCLGQGAGLLGENLGSRGGVAKSRHMTRQPDESPTRARGVQNRRTCHMRHGRRRIRRRRNYVQPAVGALSRCRDRADRTWSAPARNRAFPSPARKTSASRRTRC
jgi:hypothetical protein